MFNKQHFKNPYHLINTILAGFILMIFIYSCFFSAQKENHPVPSFHDELTGESTASSGLSRSFSEIIRGNFKSAREYNENGLLVFTFFLIQFFQRIIISLLLKWYIVNKNIVLVADVIISVFLFAFCFHNLIGDYFKTVFL